MSKTTKYSIVIPLKNEEGNVKELLGEIKPVMDSVGQPWEIICVDDGSTDSTASILKDLTTKEKSLKVITFERNFGQSSAFDAGFKAAQGEFVITMDGDRQNDPNDIPKLIDALGDADLICGIRRKRRDKFFKRIISRVANRVRGRLCGDGMKDTGCSLKIYRTACLQDIKMYHGMHRFLPALFTIEGFSTRQVDVNHRQRAAGKTKYNILNRSFNTIADLFAVMWMRKRQLHYSVKRK